MPDTHTSGLPDVHADLHSARAAVGRAIADSLEVSKAARLLGLTRAQLRSRIEKHGIAAEGS